MNSALQFFTVHLSVAAPAARWLAFLGGIAIKGTIVLVATYGISTALRRASAAARHLVWTAALGALLALPLLSLALPAWRIAVTGAGATQSAALPGQGAGPRQMSGLAAASEPQIGRTTRELSPSDRAQRATVWPLWVLLAWGTGAIFVLTRLAVGALGVRSIARKAIKFDEARRELVNSLSQQLQLRRAVAVVASDEVSMPMVSGVIRPVVLLPASAASWPPERLRVVLTHELAHIKRRDCLTQLVGQIACALYWFHPFAWLAASRLRQERERASDDLVLAIGTQATDYAEHLVQLARDLRPAELSWPAAVAMAQSSSLESRVRAILDSGVNRRRLSLRAAILAVSALVAIAVPLAAMQASVKKEAGEIRGTVYDPSGAVVPDAMVKISNSETKQTLTGSTNQEGVYEFPALPAGRYDLEISHPGFAFLRRDGVVAPGGTLLVDVTLGSVLGLTQNIEVVAKAPPGTASFRGKKFELGPRVPHRIRVGGAVQAAKLISQVKPVYPPEAVEKGIEGTVLMNAVIGMDGRVLSLKVINEPDDALAKAAVAAVEQWSYSPTLLNGEPIEVVTTISVNFRLEN